MKGKLVFSLIKIKKSGRLVATSSHSSDECGSLWWQKMAFQGIFQFILVVATYMDGACIVIPTSLVSLDFIFSFFFLSLLLNLCTVPKKNRNPSIYLFLRFIPSYFNCISFISINYFKLDIILISYSFNFFISHVWSPFFYLLFVYSIWFFILFFLQFHPPLVFFPISLIIILFIFFFEKFFK